MCLCPSCAFPASYTELTELVESSGECPMCKQAVLPEEIVRMDPGEAVDWLTKQTNSIRHSLNQS